MHDRAPDMPDLNRANAARPSADASGVLPFRAARSAGDEAPRPPAPDDVGDLSPALEDVVRRFGSFIRRTAHRHNLGPTEVEDVVQETRIRLWTALGTASRIREAPASYIYRTTMSAALDFIRRRRARREEALGDDVGSARTLTSSQRADDRVVDVETRQAIVRAVDLLVESRRAVVRMYLAGYDREEIADLLGWSEAKTRNLLYRGLTDARESLESWGFGPGAKE
jgi:RNA polymerase sigma-70 factor (ECF subfamily)